MVSLVSTYPNLLPNSDSNHPKLEEQANLKQQLEELEVTREMGKRLRSSNRCSLWELRWIIVTLPGSLILIDTVENCCTTHVFIYTTIIHLVGLSWNSVEKSIVLEHFV